MSDSTEKATPHMTGSSSEADILLKRHLAQFTLSLLKALMTTGIYPPEHPAVKEVASEPYLHLKRLAPTTNEITYMSASAAIGDELMVDGVLPEAIPFVALMHSSMGEVFARKFISYFERNQLVSFSIKTRIGKAELQKLISVFSEFRAKEEGGLAEAQDFSELLLANGIVHVSAMVRSEVIGGERPLPWRVKMAISRLRKDLRNIPFYAEASSLELAKAKQALIQDITRPLRRPQFLKELMANTDLITHDVEELEEEEVRREVIGGLHPGMLVNIAWDIVGDLERASWGAIHQNVGGVERRLDVIFKEMLKESALRLKDHDPQTVKELTRHLFDKQILTYAELPEALQDEMRLDKWTEQFLATRKAALRRLQSLQDVAVYEEYIKTLKPVFGELLRRERVDICLEMVRVFAEHARNADPGAPGREDLAELALESFAQEANLSILCREAQSPRRDTRRRAFECLELFGDPAVSALMELLWESDSPTVRREAVASLESLGEEIHVPLLEILGEGGHEWYVYRNTLLLVKRTDCVAAADDVRKFLRFPHPRVREEAMSTLAHFAGDAACPDVLELLADKDVKVRRKAISLLAEHGCKYPQFLSLLLKIVSPVPEGRLPPDPSLVLEALRAIAQVGVFEADGKDIRAPLLMRLNRETKSKLKKWLKKDDEGDDDRIRCAVLDTLGAIGDGAVSERLKPVLQDPSPRVREKTIEAIRTIRGRKLAK